jgi:hypothetical protein
MDVADHFFVMVGRLVDDAVIGRIGLVVSMADGDVIEGVPTEPAGPAWGPEELDDTGYACRIELGGVTVALSDVRRVTVVYPEGG